MKKVIGLAVVFVSFFLNMVAAYHCSEAAKEIIVKPVTKEISRGKQPGMKVDIYQATKKEVVKAWSKKINQNTKSKVEERENEIFIIGTHISEITNEPLNIYAVINDYMDYVEVNAFFETRDGFITQEKAETEYLSCRKFLREFGVACYQDAVRQEIKKEEKVLEGLNTEMRTIVHTNDKLHKNIAKEERDIVDARNDIELNEMEQDRLRSEIYDARGHLYKIRGEEARKEAEQEIDALEKKLSELKRKNESLHKEIVKSEADIRSFQRSIEDNNLMVARKEVEIDRQLDVIYRVEQKLVAIR